MVDDISHEGLRVLLHQEGVSFQVIKTWKQSSDPDLEAKKNRILHLYGLMDGDPEVVICVDEFGPLNLQPHPGRQWRAAVAAASDLHPPPWGRVPAGRRRPFPRPAVWPDQAPQRRGEFLVLLRYLRTLYPPGIRLGIVLDNFSPTCRPATTLEWPSGRRPTTSSSPTPDQRVMAEPDRGPVPGAALLHPRRHRPHQHHEQASMIRRYIVWRNRNAHDHRFRQIIDRAKVA